MRNQRILLGVSGGIAAYKTPELVRRLREQGAEVRVVMTAAAQAFITPLTLQAVSGHSVHTELLSPEAESAFGHIDLARWADVILIAPASADIIARLAHGLADDLLTTLCLASAAPLCLAPAMNRQMWAAAATEYNCELLEERGARFFGPAEGAQACGETGAGRLLEPTALVEELARLFPSADERLRGRRILVTAGPTREDLDPVRYLSNRSSGRMGYAIAAAARDRDAEVTLVSGPTALPVPEGICKIGVYSAREMYDAVHAGIADADIFIATAAVADYRPVAQAGHKIKKHNDKLVLELERTEDILASVAALDARPFCVGFAAETERLEEYAKNKLSRKGLDMVAANQVGIAGQGFDSEENALRVFWPGGEKTLPLASKNRIAQQLLGLVADRYALGKEKAEARRNGESGAE